MGVVLCIGKNIHTMNVAEAINFDILNTFGRSNESAIQKIRNYLNVHNSIFVLLGVGNHKIKRKAEKQACEEAIKHFL